MQSEMGTKLNRGSDEGVKWRWTQNRDRNDGGRFKGEAGRGGFGNVKAQAQVKVTPG